MKPFLANGGVMDIRHSPTEIAPPYFLPFPGVNTALEQKKKKKTGLRGHEEEYNRRMKFNSFGRLRVLFFANLRRCKKRVPVNRNDWFHVYLYSQTETRNVTFPPAAP
jgi:hypothetical protein